MTKIYLDMDGVLTQFVSESIKFCGQDPEEIFKKWVPGEWGAHTALGISLGEFWNKVDVEDFWQNLPIYNYAKQLIGTCKNYGEVRILTAPANSAWSYYGKKKIVEKYFPTTPLIIMKEKELLARPNDVLIDDKLSNIEKWILNDGYGILFPQLWNDLHKYKDSNKIKYISKKLKQ